MEEEGGPEMAGGAGPLIYRDIHVPTFFQR